MIISVERQFVATGKTLKQSLRKIMIAPNSKMRMWVNAGDLYAGVRKFVCGMDVS
jgi:hypothetical protein